MRNIFLLFLLTLSLQLKAWTVAVDVDDLRYWVDTETNTAELYGPVSTSTTFNDLVIPDYITYNYAQVPVTAIRNNAFGSNTNLKGSLTIGNNVQTIGERAFGDCSGLTGTLTIGDNVQTIGSHAFYSCSGLKGELIIPNSVQTIEARAFYNCFRFTGLTIGNNVQAIGGAAFFACFGLKGELIIPNSVVEIGEFAFFGCTGFTGELTIGENVQWIGDGAFNGCSGFTGSLIIPNSVQTIKRETFSRCSGFTGELIIPNSVVEIGEFAFSDCNKFDSLTIPNSVQTIGRSAFSGCTGFTGTLTIPNSVQTIKKEAFYGCLFSNVVSIAAKPPKAETDAFHDFYISPLYVPDESVELYRTAEEWKNFRNINPPSFIVVVSAASSTTLRYGETVQLFATTMPEDASRPNTFTWSSSDEQIAKVDPVTGIVTAGSKLGNATITATTTNESNQAVSGNITITVEATPASQIILSENNISMVVGNSVDISATVLPETTTDKTVTWKSDNEAVATVATDGTITAVSAGTANITATCGEATATCKVTVNPVEVEVTSIELNIKDMVLFIGQSETIQAIVRPANATNTVVSWQSDNESIATVTADGKVTGINEGVATITASCGEVSATCTVTVNPIPASNIEITTGDVTLTIGSTTDLVAKVSPENTTHPDVEWLSSDTDIATITADGTVTAVSVGTAIITAKCGNVSATCTVTVIPVPSEGIVVTPTSVSMLLGDEVTLSATVFPENTTDKTITWGSDNPAVASVSSTGVVTALGLGSATITASNGTSKATCAVTVNPVVATSISLNVKDETIFVASTTQLVATISPSNVTDKTITWTSSKPEIATVSDGGLVTGLAVGTTTVTATIGSVSASCQINVVHRIPDMDPSVTTSDRDIKTMSGRPVNMAVYPAGGEPTGWSYTWTKNGEVVSKSAELNITAINESATVIAETYRVKVENEIDKVIILSEIFDFVVQIYPAVGLIPDDGGISISGGDGGTANKTREGNTVTLSATAPSGGYPQGWEYVWSAGQGEIGDGEAIETVASMSAGTSMAVEQTTYRLEMTNYGPEGDVWAKLNFNSNLEVYRRPQTPLQLLRKGDGTSHTFVAMMPMADSQLEQLEYKFVYGLTDSKGNDRIIDITDLRYCHTEADVYNNSTNKFWVYTIWNYRDGSVVSSGLRYLDGSVDESFDASAFDGGGAYKQPEGASRKAVYSIDGQYMGDNPNKLLPGIYIVISESNGVKKIQKIIIR